MSERKLIAEAREWSRIVEADPDWRKGYVEDGLHHVARLADALEAASKGEEGLLWLGRRIEVGAAKGDRERFRGRRGRVAREQPRRARLARGVPEAYIHVILDGTRESRVFLPHELTLVSGVGHKSE